MWPWGHLAVGYFLYSSWCRLSNRRSPSAIGTLFVAVGTQFPDLIDKPFAWTFSLLPTGRSLTHSLLTAVLVLGGIRYVACRRFRRLPWRAFAIGYLSHLLGDAVKPLQTGDVENLTFLLWPLLPSPAYETPKSFIAHFAGLKLTPVVIAEFVLVGIAVGVWITDETPGLTELRRLWLASTERTVENR